MTKEQELWSGVAFAICSKNRNDLKELVKKVDDYRSTGEINAIERSGSKLNKKGSGASSRLGSSPNLKAPSNLKVGQYQRQKSTLSNSR